MTHLRTDLYNRLPAIWRALDKELVLKRFLGVVDHDFNSIEQLITEFLEVHSVDRIPTIHLKVLGNLVGYRWRSDRTLIWNRNRIRDSIHKYSYKGSIECVKDLAIDYGSELNMLQDNASKLLILGKQGRLSCDDAYLVTADYWHDGAFVAQFNKVGDTDGLGIVIPGIIPVGERWYVEFQRVLSAYPDEFVGILITDGMSISNARDGMIGFGRLGEDLVVNIEPNGDVYFTYKTGYWHVINPAQPFLGNELLGIDLALWPEPNGSLEWSYKPLHWRTFDLTGPATLGGGILGIGFYLSVEPCGDTYIPT